MERRLAAAQKAAKDAKDELKRNAAAAAQGSATTTTVDEEMGGQEARKWDCESCGAPRRKHMQSCRICAIPRVATQPTGSTAPYSPEETEAKYAKLSEQLTVPKSFVPADLVAKPIAALQAQMLQLKAQPAAATVKTVRECYEQAQEALDRIEARQEALVAKSLSLVERIEELKQDLDAATWAIRLVCEEQATASAHRDAAMMAVRGPTTTAEATTAAAPIATAAAVAAIREYNTKLCEVISGTSLPEINEKYLEYKEKQIAMGLIPMDQMEFVFTAFKQQLMVQADEQMASLAAGAPQQSQTHHGEPASPVTTEAATTLTAGGPARSGGQQAPDAASTPTVAVGAAPRDPGDGQQGQRAGTQRASIKSIPIGESKALANATIMMVEQRNAMRSEQHSAKRSEGC